MNKQIIAHIHALLNACLIVNAAGGHHVFFDFSGHVDSVSVYAHGCDASYTQEAPAPRKLVNLHIYVTPMSFESESEAVPRALKQLKKATKAVLALLEMEVPHVA